MIEFEGEFYRDDRLFVLYVARCYLAPPDKGMAHSTIFHKEPYPAPSPGVQDLWCVVTYRNTERYPLYRLDHFHSKRLAEGYFQHTEPFTPLVSLGGKSIEPAPSSEEWASRKKKQGWKDYDYRLIYPPGGSHPRETISMKADAVNIFLES